MICPKCQIQWADFPVDITKERMTKEQEFARLQVYYNEEHKFCPACQADMWEHTYYNMEDGNVYL